MQITNEILISFIHCSYKGYKKYKSEIGEISDYEKLYDRLKQTQRTNFQNTITENKTLVSSNAIFKNIIPKEGFALSLRFTNEKIDLVLDAVEFIGKNNIVSVLFTPFEKITLSDKLFLSLQAEFLKNEFNLQTENCKIIHGENLKQSKLKVSSMASAVKKSIDELDKTLSNSNAPVFYRNNHCQVCEFQKSCMERLKERDDLSLLSGLRWKEIQQKNNRGIFSVRQLSYSFRPKKNHYRKRNFLPELKALAIREGKTFIQEIPSIKTSATQIFIDIEGLPDRDFYYLIGVIVKTKDLETEYSFWANNRNDESTIFIELIKLLRSLEEWTIYHYGSYEIQALKRISKKLSSENQKIIKKIINNSFNILHVFTNNIYPPTYSNSLKDIARFLKFDWSERNASGLQSTLWRYNWAAANNDELKNKLITYNLEDCRALMIIEKWILNIPIGENEWYKRTNNFKIESQYKLGKANFLIKELEQINNYAYFSYQRNKVLIKTYPKIAKVQDSRSKIITPRKKQRPNKIIEVQQPRRCPKCRKNFFCKHNKNQKKVVIDLKITKTGVRKLVTLHYTNRFRCVNCEYVFTPKTFLEISSKYGRTLHCWMINQAIQYRISYNRITSLLKESFDIDYPNSAHRVKTLFAEYYKTTFREMFNSLKCGSLLHIDETTFKLKNGKGYVWVFTNIDTVCYLYRPTRETDFLKEILADFKGVLICDFYAGYDFINCPKQRCLIHLIRDLNDGLVKNQQNDEYKNLVSDFSELLNEIISTVNLFGLKKRYLGKHKKRIVSFFKRLKELEFGTEICMKLKKRFLSVQEELFTFMDYNGVPWNNNNAETAIKAVALHRRDTEGLTTQKGIQEYLPLLSIHQTCKYRGINFLKFLLSGEKNISKFSKRRK